MISRRHFLQSSLAVALVPFVPRSAFTATTLKIRPSWQTFRESPMYQVLLDTLSTMQANTNNADPNSWNYWADVHKCCCPHRKPYFLAWHRGYLFRFEQQLRKIANNSSLTFPYWDYYTSPIVPPEFTSDTASPLYVPNRNSDNVTNALTLAPFDPSVTNFQRGLTDAFEPSLETLPHNAVHNLIGGVLGQVTISPRDPIFWVHHANIDRLWAAWVKADHGRHMPSRTDPYWSGTFTYGAAVPSMSYLSTIAITGLGYDYEDTSMPAALPITTTTLAPLALQLQATPPKSISSQSVSLGGAQQLVLNENSVSVNVSLTPQGGNRVRSLLLARPSTNNGLASASSSIRVVLDGVKLTGLGKQGGYFYKVYINLPEQPGISLADSTYLLGTLGSFEITGYEAMQQMQQMQQMQGGATVPSGGGVQVSFPATEALQRIAPSNLDKLTISFVRVDGDKPIKGTTITVKEVRVEASDTLAQ
jgi:tyrosinase